MSGISAWQSNSNELDEIDSALVGRGLESSGKYVESMEIESGAIVITYGNGAHPQIRGRVLTLAPATDESMSIAWACGYGRAPTGHEVVFDDHEQYSDVPERYVPSSCRP